MSINAVRRPVLCKLDAWLKQHREKLKQAAQDRCPLRLSSEKDLNKYRLFLQDAVGDAAASLSESVALELNAEANSFLLNHGPTGSVAEWNEDGTDEAVLQDANYEPSRFTFSLPTGSRKGIITGVGIGISPAIATALLLPDPFTKTWSLSVLGSSVVGGTAGFTVYRKIEKDTQKEEQQRLLSNANGYIEEEMATIKKWIEREVVDKYVDALSSFLLREGINQAGEER
jgi:hypothetical protein